MLELAIQENVKNTYKDIMKSPIVSHLVQEGKLKVVAAEYQLKNGKVETIESAAASTTSINQTGVNIYGALP
jgi:carbonic anhydrase